MTTIAIDRYGTIAADGQTASEGGERLSSDSRKILVRKAEASRPARIFALTGCRPMTWPLIEWYERGAAPKEMPTAKPGVSFTLIVIEIGPDGAPMLSIVSDELPYPSVNLGLPQAFGSGGAFAQGVLVYGGTAREAVEVAIGLDIHSGGQIQVENYREALGLDIPVPNGLGTTHRSDGDGAPAPTL